MTMLPFLFSAAFMPVAASQDVDERLRYVRPSGDKYVLETEILKRNLPGDKYLSVTHRPGVQMRVLINFDKSGRITTAQVTQTTKSGKSSIDAKFKDASVVITAGDKLIKKLTISTAPILVTTAPDWSDIMLLLRRYDQKKSGKQEFSGLWFHPTKEARIRSFTVEKIGKAGIKADGETIDLGKFRVVLRSGGYVVWANNDGLVYKLVPAGNAKAAVILKGFESSTQTLVP